MGKWRKKRIYMSPCMLLKYMIEIFPDPIFSLGREHKWGVLNENKNKPKVICIFILRAILLCTC